MNQDTLFVQRKDRNHRKEKIGASKEKQKEFERKEADRIKKAEAFRSDICY